MPVHSILQNSEITVKCLLISLFCLPFNLKAQTFDHPGRLDFNVHLQSVYSDWHYDNNKRQRTGISRVGFGWSETLNPGLSGGLMLGYLDLSQTDNPINTAKLTTGYYGGLQLETRLIENRYLCLNLNVSIVYNDSQNQADNLNIHNIWIQTEEKLQASIPLRKQLELRLAVNSYQLRGEQRSSGSITDVSNFRQQQNIGYSIGLDVLVDADASIGFDWSGGSRTGGRLYFRRLF